jgi:hypothetical protein
VVNKLPWSSSASGAVILQNDSKTPDIIGSCAVLAPVPYGPLREALSYDFVPTSGSSPRKVQMGR